jgi:putative ABC transport system permease protein
MLLSALAVAFLAGLRCTAPDMKHTADLYYKEQNLMDLRMQSTLGLTQDDLAAVRGYSGVRQAEGVKQLDCITESVTVSVFSLPDQIDRLDVTGGRLPEKDGECVTEQKLMDRYGWTIGSQITLDPGEDNADDLKEKKYTIVGTVRSPLFLSAARGSSTIGTGSVTAFVFLPEDEFTTDYYTAVDMTLDGTQGMEAYTGAYDDFTENFRDGMKSFADGLVQQRHDSLYNDAAQKLADARKEYEDGKADSDSRLADAKQKLEDSRKELDDGWKAYNDAVAKDEIGKGRKKLASSRAEYESGLKQYESGLSTYKSGLAQYSSGLTSYNDGLSQYNAAAASLQAQEAALGAAFEAAVQGLDSTSAAYSAAAAPYTQQKEMLDVAEEQLVPQKEKLDASKATLDQTKAQLNAAKAKLAKTKQQLDSAKAELESGEKKLDAAQKELDENKQKLTDGEQDYKDGLQKYETSKQDADTKLSDAQKKLDDAQDELDVMDEGKCYLLGRDSNAGCVGYGQDADRMSNLARVFPIIFFLVAALSSLTAVTRMVSENRSEIGVLKAIGYGKRQIAVKYIGYAFSASLTGGILGAAVGCSLIPYVIANAWLIMYSLPSVVYEEQPFTVIAAIAAAVLSTTVTAAVACWSELHETPAELMRPRAPEPGKRVLLERITPVWSRLTFIRKVTVRNLFHYRQRFWMTVIGIAGCTALLVTAFGLHDSIFDIMTLQYDEITTYDVMAGLKDNVTAAETAKIRDLTDGSGLVENACFSYEAVSDTSSDKGAVDGAYLFVVDDEDNFGKIVSLRHRVGGQKVTLQENGAVITEKLASLLRLKKGDSITITLPDDSRVQVPVTDITENYIYHYVYMTKAYYASIAGEAPADNVLLLQLKNDTQEDSDTLSRQLMATDGVSSYTRVDEYRQRLQGSLNSINYAVIIIIVAAAALAFVVQFNLTNINITERRRELATLKVLGFQNGETASYIFRETVVLTIIGMVIGLYGGYLLHAWLITTVEINIAMFGRSVKPLSYVFAILMTFVFTAVVSLISYFSVRKVDMVESLKTVE